MTDQSTKPTISLSLSVVCYHTNPFELQQLISSVFVAITHAKQHWRFGRLHFAVIDNSERNGLDDRVLAGLKVTADSLDVELALIRGHGNVGYGRGHNLAIADAKSDFHLLLNPDVVLDSECLSEGLSFLLSELDVVLISPLATNEAGEKQYLCKRYPSVFTLFVRGFLPASWQAKFKHRLAVYEMRELSETKPTASVPIASGCFMLCSSEALRAVGGFDERYFLYFEDFDLSLRLAKLGQIAYVPAMKISHSGGNAAKKGFKHIAMFARSGIRFFNTHGWRWFS